MKKLIIRIGAIFIIVTVILLPITWFLFLAHYDPYDSEPGYNVLNSDEYQDGDIVNIWGERTGSSTRDGKTFIYLDTMRLENKGSLNHNRIITIAPIIFEEPIDESDFESMHRYMVIKCRVEGSGDSKTIIGLEFYPDAKFWHQFFLSFEILFLIIGFLLYFPTANKVMKKEFTQKNNEQNDIASPPAPSR
jgi:hypothetical protein